MISAGWELFWKFLMKRHLSSSHVFINVSVKRPAFEMWETSLKFLIMLV